MSRQIDAEEVGEDTYGFQLGSDEYVSHVLKDAILDARKQALDAKVRSRESVIDGRYSEFDANTMFREYVERYILELEPIMVNPERFLTDGQIDSTRFNKYYNTVALGEVTFYSRVPDKLQKRGSEDWQPVNEVLENKQFRGLRSILQESDEYVYQSEFTMSSNWGRNKTQVAHETRQIPRRILKNAVRVADLFCQDIGIKIRTGALPIDNPEPD